MERVDNTCMYRSTSKACIVQQSRSGTLQSVNVKHLLADTRSQQAWPARSGSLACASAFSSQSWEGCMRFNKETKKQCPPLYSPA